MTEEIKHKLSRSRKVLKDLEQEEEIYYRDLTSATARDREKEAYFYYGKQAASQLEHLYTHLLEVARSMAVARSENNESMIKLIEEELIICSKENKKSDD
jgi:hypothetical protein